MTRVAVLGVGIIGKRVATALITAAAGGSDLNLAGVVLRGPNVFASARPEIPVYAADRDAAQKLTAVGCEPWGLAEDLFAVADVVVDCGPSRTGARRAAWYRAAGIRPVFCGGERDRDLGPLIHSAVNPEDAKTPGGLRLPSCNTTAFTRVIAGAGPAEIALVEATLLRCSTDTDKAGKGRTNGALLTVGESHHADDLRALFPGLTVHTVAATIPMTAGHLIQARITPTGRVDADELWRRLGRTGRIRTTRGPEPVDTSLLKGESQRQWHDRPVLDVARIDAGSSDRLDVWLALDNQAITVPETLDVLQLASGVTDAAHARSESDRILGEHTLEEA